MRDSHIGAPPNLGPRKIAACAFGASAAGAYAALAYVFADSQPLAKAALTFVFALGPGIALGWAALIWSKRPPKDEHAEDNVEGTWYRDAIQGAFHDLVAVIGLTAGVIAVCNLAPPADLVLCVIWLAMAADVALRYLANRRIDWASTRAQ